jgi:hypothetical protein
MKILILAAKERREQKDTERKAGISPVLFLRSLCSLAANKSCAQRAETG